MSPHHEVQVLDWAGSDYTVVAAARVYPSSKFLESRAAPIAQKDIDLINYMARHEHFTPFTHCVASFYIKAPFYVRAQLFKHQVGLSANEESRRYRSAPPDIDIINEWRAASHTRKQGSSEAMRISDELEQGIYQYYREAILLYNGLIGEGVAPEQARSVLPLSTMTSWWWTGSLAAYARIYKLRTSEDAQLETKNVVLDIGRDLEYIFPHSWKALTA